VGACSWAALTTLATLKAERAARAEPQAKSTDYHIDVLLSRLAASGTAAASPCAGLRNVLDYAMMRVPVGGAWPL
jgi:hypothetical protein